MKTVYLDNAATTRTDERVLKAMDECSIGAYANPSSIHFEGLRAREIVEGARKTIADSILAKPEELIFTSGGTESNNFAIKGIAFANREKGKHIITSKIEHECVLSSCKWLVGQGFEITYLDVDGQGFVPAHELEKAIGKGTILVSIIHANNEIGTIQDLDALYKVCKKKGVYFHTDACQSYSKSKIDSSMADLITLNAHKLHGPKGVGALYIKKGVKISPWAHGGGHEWGMRSGTENVPAILGFAKAYEIAKKEGKAREMGELRDYLILELLKVEGTMLNGPRGEKRLCNNVNISFAGIEGESIVEDLSMAGICTSTGSACASRSLDPSHVIMAIGSSHERAHGSIRFSISRWTTKEEIDYVVKHVKETVLRLRKISPVGKVK